MNPLQIFAAAGHQPQDEFEDDAVAEPDLHRRRQRRQATGLFSAGPASKQTPGGGGGDEGVGPN